MKTLGEIFQGCSVLGKVIVLPKDMGYLKGYDESLFQRLKMIMYEKGGEYYPSDKHRGFVFRDFIDKIETQKLLDNLRDQYSESKNILNKITKILKP